MPDPAAVVVRAERLELDRSPAAVITAAALQAQRDAELDKADFIIVACPRGAELDLDAVDRAVERAVGTAN